VDSVQYPDLLGVAVAHVVVWDAQGVMIQEWLDTEVDTSGGPADAEQTRRALGITGAAAARTRARLDHLESSGMTGGERIGALSISKSTAADLQRCEGFAVARRGSLGAESTWEMLAGRALDAYVAHVNHVGAVADPVEDLASVWEAQGRHEDAARVRAEGQEPGRLERLSSLAMAAAHAEVDPVWVPRVEVGLGVTVGDAIALNGRVDLLLGGPGTGRPTVVVEVKSGSQHSDHHAELRHYLLLAALRHGEMPAAAAVWYPDGTLARMHVAGTAESSAMRVAAAAAAVADMWEGRPPTLHPGGHCRWCPVADVCPRAQDPQTGGAA